MRVLVVEDDPVLLTQIADALEIIGYTIERANDGELAQRLGDTEPFDAIVLDLGLPKVDGLTILKRWRDNGVSTPVIILTVRSRWHEKVDGIDAGADDYLTKPFHMAELAARVRALIRRSAGISGPEISCGDIRIDMRNQAVFHAGNLVSLTAHEYKVISYLAHHADQIVSKEELSQHIYARPHERDSNTIEVFIGRLRRKFSTDTIETIRGVGYRIRKARRADESL
jgi:two-component system OmpR family response regulator